MKDIKIGRYDQDCFSVAPDGTKQPLGFGGWVEDEDQTWILFLDTEGKPSVYYSQRDDLGGVISEPLSL